MFPLMIAGCSDKPEDVNASRDDASSIMKDLDTPASKNKSSQSGPQPIAAPAGGTIRISPSLPTVVDSLSIIVPARLNTSGAIVSWRLNGAILSGQSGMTLGFSGMEVLKGDTVSVELLVGSASYLSPEITLMNAAPEIKSMRLMPKAFKPGEKLYAEVRVSDADNDRFTISYEWYVNGSPAGKTKTLDKGVGRGDAVEVRVVAYDGEDYSPEGVLGLKINNFPPMLEEHYKYTFDGTTYTYQARATDQDGDTITYTLTSGPQAMTIDAITGKVIWQVPEDFVGTADYTIVAEDGAGGSSVLEQSFRLTLEK
jgi:hypothetical protein